MERKLYKHKILFYEYKIVYDYKIIIEKSEVV